MFEAAAYKQIKFVHHADDEAPDRAELFVKNTHL
jgi:hypothetical protein